MAVAHDRHRPALAVHRSARRQSGADRPDGCRRRRHRFFDLLVKIGIKEIEVGFPAAGATEFDFIAGLVKSGRIPDDVTVQVLTQSRRDLIETSFASLRRRESRDRPSLQCGSPAWREIVFGMTSAEVKQIAIDGATILRDQAAA